MKRLQQSRILMYSHDTFGLGHLRRCRAIAHALVERFKGLSVLIISGSQIAGAFDFKARVDFLKIPSIIKLRNGEYTSIDEHIDIQETLKIRASLIQHAASAFKPDIFIVDKEPLGLVGELEETLTLLKEAGCELVLGLRDVMDAPEALKSEWRKRDLISKITAFYDAVWIYGTEDFWDPLRGLPIPPELAQRIEFTGFLGRSMPAVVKTQAESFGEFILVTAGGGGDGANLFNCVLAAYDHDPAIPLNAVLVLGPFMSTQDRQEIMDRCEGSDHLFIIDFDAQLERLMADCAGMVSMCGYNTFCELISFNKRGLVIPRTAPRQEQMVRAQRAMELGLLDVLSAQEAADPAFLAQALRALPIRPKPMENNAARMMYGLDRIAELTWAMLQHRAHTTKRSQPPVSV